MSINLSAQDIRNPNLLKDIDHILAETGLDGKFITVEITEGMLITDMNQTIDLLTEIKARNIQVSIDDFGTGYSSLNYIHRLPADYLKIDCSFVNQIQETERNYQVVRTIITLSNQLGLAVIAEGIETSAQLDILRDLECEFGQGYLFSKPLSVQEIEAKFIL
jgi:EAL domain-containing protein (putative c-di-GMP-specific phosphodiesterase class I)